MLLLRTCSLILTYYCGIRSIYYATLANINFGIVSCCFIVSVLVNSVFNFIFFGEKIILKTLLGMVITISGIMWISLSKGQAAIKLEGAAGFGS